jgi:hypothetical protein
MVHRFLVSCSFVCCAVVIASFGFFAVDQVSGASSEQAAQIASGSPTPPAKTPAHHGAVRRIVDSVYGVGLGYLARYSSGLP